MRPCISELTLTHLGNHIHRLREGGLSYAEIAAAIPCSKSSVAYYLTEGTKEAAIVRNRNRRKRLASAIKSENGAECVVCGYKKCIQALEFDHLFPENKSRSLNQMRDSPLDERLKEAAKCLLLCCRCHRERHAGLLDIGAYLEPTI